MPVTPDEDVRRHTARSTRRLVLAVWLVLIALVAGATAGCGGGSDDSDEAADTSEADDSAPTTDDDAGEEADDEGDDEPDADDGDLCRLVTKDEAEAITGKTFEAGRPTSSDGPLGLTGSCVYTIVGDNGAASTIVNVIVLGTKVTQEQFDGQLAEDAPESADVDGVGQQAKLVQPGILAVFDDGVALTVQILVDSQPVDTDVLVGVASKALDRL